MTTLWDKVKKTIHKHRMLANGDHVILGLSGGPDSLSLFYVLKDLSKEWGAAFSCVHVNHMFRQKEAREDQKSVEKLCQTYDIPCYSYVVDCPTMAKEEGLSLEEAGRKARYEAFGKAAAAISQGNARSNSENIKVAVAQNQNDQAETVLMRIIRGTGLDGLGAMEYSRKDVHGYMVIRPLLDVSRKEIEEYCADRQLTPRIDNTNDDDQYIRNKIRHQLLPYLEENFNPKIVEGLSRMAENLQKDKAYLQEQTAIVTTSVSCKVDTGKADEKNRSSVFYRDKLNALSEALRNRVVRHAFAEIGLDKDIAAIHLQQANCLLTSENASGTVNFPGGYILQVSYNQVFILEPNRESSKTVSAKLKKTFLSPKDVQLLNADKDKNLQQRVCQLDAEEIGKKEKAVGAIELRTRKPGDWMAMRFGTKRIQDLFIDSHVPKEERDNIYMVALGSEILWIPDVQGKSRYTASYKVGEDTGLVLQLEIIK